MEERQVNQRKRVKEKIQNNHINLKIGKVHRLKKTYQMSLKYQRRNLVLLIVQILWKNKLLEDPYLVFLGKKYYNDLLLYFRKIKKFS